LPNESRIVSVIAREILDSRGNPTVEVEVGTPLGIGRASVPSGASTGTNEALELRDGNPDRFHGKGVTKAVNNVNRVIAPKLLGMDCENQRQIDRLMIDLDGTPNKRSLGANAILGTSMAIARAASVSGGVSLFERLRVASTYRLPVPMMNVINGGEHADNDLVIQEFMVVPKGALSFREALRFGSEVYHSLKSVLSSKYGGGATNVGDEGGFAPPMKRTREALEALNEAVRKSGHTEDDVRLGMDAAASTFYDRETRKYSLDGGTITSERLEGFYGSLCDEYGLVLIEDPFAEEEFDAFAEITKTLGKKVKIIGDDLYCTNVKRIATGIELKSTNAVLIKLNQIGTVTETEEAITMAQRAGWAIAVSHRSGETEDPFIAHLATAFSTELIKSGAPARGERIAKYNELIRVEEELGKKALFAGSSLG
jgi:enolase